MSIIANIINPYVEDNNKIQGCKEQLIAEKAEEYSSCMTRLSESI